MTVRALEGRVALVTGSSRGIGAAIARRFADEGAAVAVHGRDEAALEKVLAEVRWHGGEVVAVKGDVRHVDEVEAMRDAVERALGPIDVLVANAGGNLTPPAQPIEETSVEGWRASLDVNLTGAFLSIRSVLPGMKALGRGSIVTISSAAARRPSAASPIPYAVAKAGLELLTKDVAAQAGPCGVRVNCIAPETILTERNESRIDPELRERLAAEHPLRRLGTPEDVAEAALWLASDASGWVTGVVLDVAGGAVLR